jgi:hypothetical protein
MVDFESVLWAAVRTETVTLLQNLGPVSFLMLIIGAKTAAGSDC